MFGKTGFKISGTVGIIILLLGITILFGSYQMSRVSQEIVMVSEAYEPLQGLLGEIKFYQTRQANSFEKMSADPTSDSAREEFWSSGVIIKSDIRQAKKIAETGYSVAPTDSVGNNFRLVHKMLADIEQEHNGFEEITKNQESGRLLPILISKEEQIQVRIDDALAQIERFNEEAISSIEEYERGWLYVQIGIIVIVGVISVFLKSFTNQINNGLKAEIEEKTRELQEANKRLQELDAKKDEFISIASHELKGPIQPIFGFAELAQSGYIDQKEAWDGVTTLAKKLQGLANDILEVTRIENNRLELRLQDFSINEIILETIKMQKVGLEKKITLGVSLGRDAIVHVDRTRIEQVLRNILANAIKFTETGAITISTRIEKDALFITIRDTGPGIPEEILPNIFDKFVTRNHAREDQPGNGLGLFLCKGIIDAHGGRITAHNNKEGGATFEFSIPLVKKTVESLANSV